MNGVLRSLFFLLVVRPILLILLGLNIFGRGHLPRDRQLILVANHNSHLDALVLMDLFPLHRLHRVRPVAAEDYFAKNELLRCFVQRCLNVLLIPRSGFTKSNNPLSLMGEALQAGDSLILFPEGTRGAPEELGEFQPGIAHLVRKFKDIPVVPVFLRGMGRSLPKGEKILIPFFGDVVIGAPLDLSAQGDRTQILEQIQKEILQLAAWLEELSRAETAEEG